MSDVTWKWLTDSLLPALMQQAEYAGVESGSWALTTRVDGAKLVKQDAAGAELGVLARYEAPQEALCYMNGMICAFQLVQDLTN